MVKKSRKVSRKNRRRTHRRYPKRKGGGDSLPLVPPDSSFPHSTAGENSDNVMGLTQRK
jgi:hypothetical protein